MTDSRAPSQPKRVIWLALPLVSSSYDNIRKLFAAHGMIDGRDVSLTIRELTPTDRSVSGGKALADRLAAERPDVIVTPFIPNILYPLQRRIRDIPIVFQFAGRDPVAMGFVESLRRPGGNITGTMQGQYGPGAFQKKWELLKQVAPALKRGGILMTTETAAEIEQLPQSADGRYEPEIREVRSGLGFDVIRVPVPTNASREVINDIVAKAQVGALYLHLEPWPEAVDFLRNTKIPAIGHSFWLVRRGVLMGISSSREALEAYAVEAVERILRGANPAKIPVYVSRQVGFAINAATARANGIAIPELLLVRADEVVEK